MKPYHERDGIKAPSFAFCGRNASLFHLQQHVLACGSGGKELPSFPGYGPAFSCSCDEFLAGIQNHCARNVRTCQFSEQAWQLLLQIGRDNGHSDSVSAFLAVFLRGAPLSNMHAFFQHVLDACDHVTRASVFLKEACSFFDGVQQCVYNSCLNHTLFSHKNKDKITVPRIERATAQQKLFT